MVKNKQQQQSEGISIPRINDILLGRGGSSIHNQSNVRYRAMVREYKKEYQTYTRLQKTQLAEQLVREWHDQTPPGRFLEKDEKVGKWFVIPEKTARRKTSQLLREGAPKIRRQLKSESQEKKKKQQEEQERLRAQSPPPQLVQAPPPAAMTPSRTPVRSTVPATPNPPSSHHHLRANEQEGSRPFFPPGQSYSVLRSPVPSHYPGYQYHYDHSPYTPSYEYTPMSPPPSHYHSTPPRWQPYASGYHGPSPVPVPPTPVRAPATPKSATTALAPLAPRPSSLDVEKDNNRTSNIIPIPFAPRPTTTSTKTPGASSSSASSTCTATTTNNNKPAPLKPITPADVNQRNKLRKPPAVSRSNSCSSTGSENSVLSNKSTRSSNGHTNGKPKAPSPESVLDFDYDLPPPSVWSEDADDVDDDENIQVILGDHDTVSTLVEEFAPKALWERTPLEPLTEDEELCPPIPIRLGLSASRDESTSSSKCPQPFLTDTPASFSFSSWDCADVGVAERSSFDMMEKVIRAESDLDHTSTIDILNELDREMEAELLLPCHSF